MRDLSRYEHSVWCIEQRTIFAPMVAAARSTHHRAGRLMMMGGGGYEFGGVQVRAGVLSRGKHGEGSAAQATVANENWQAGEGSRGIVRSWLS